MDSEKKISKEDTWRADELRRHIQVQDEENKRRERSKREEPHRKHRSGESTDRRHRDGERDERERDTQKDRIKHRELERDREEQRERRREKERDGEKWGEERRTDRDEKVNRDREKERQRDRYKDRDRESEGDSRRYKERHRDTDREERDRFKKREREKEKDKEREREKHRDKERDRDRDRDRERRRTDHGKERKVKEENYREKDERGERHREREERHRNEEKEGKERERQEKHGHKENSGHIDREEKRERRRREKERYEAGERVHDDTQETERQHRHRDREAEQNRERARDREERDKQREKRHEKSKNSSNDPRHEKTDHKHRIIYQEVSTKNRTDSAWRSNQADLSDPEIPVEHEVTLDNNEAAEDYGEYEEDFEDYEEDFEEMEEDEEKQKEEQRDLSPRRKKEIEAIQRAMQQENELVRSTQTLPSTRKTEKSQKVSTDSEIHSTKNRTHDRVIDFAAARQREVNLQASDKQKKRCAELLRLIDLDYSVTTCLLDLPPVNEYDMYIKSFGMANTKQAYVQCNEDNTDRDTQTEETDTTDKWTQHPPETNIGCGGPKDSQEVSDESVLRMKVDSKRLNSFLRSAAQVVAVLLEENRTENNSVKKLSSQTDSLPFSDGCVQLNTKLPFLHGRQMPLLHFSQVQTHTLLSVHAPCSRPSGVSLDSKTLICVWNIWEPSTPHSILVYEAEVRCCCFSPGKTTLVFAGTSVGSVVLWDLREHSGSHIPLRVGGDEWTLRYPTFSTDAVLSGVGHFSAVVSVDPVPIHAEPGLRGPLLADQDESLGLSFQLGSLDENGLLNLWVVTELAKADDSGSQTDLGLRPGGKVKLLHSSSIQTSDVLTPHLSLLLKFLPSDANHYFTGTNMSVVRRGTRNGLKATPKLYSPEDGERPAQVTALDFCPMADSFFLVGCSDGTVRIHSILHEEPVLEWSVSSGNVPVLCVQWSKTRPCVFCVLDAESVLHIWDLTKADSSPVITQSLHTDRVIAMAMFGEAARQNSYSGVALAKESGILGIHFLKKTLTDPQPSEMEKLKLLAQDNL
ncbi:cytoplasmic dynein 2 intermediate chain 1 isoform X2 [Hoplias malabaricus]|uniref:cytoplasmic dynein 2 intermediate chain 1 isoform X2 n=1 Tax=Hoplias malabaricus TaxID=27720 RepID=UPI0034636B41